MSKTLVRLLPAAACLLPNLLLAAAQPAPQPAAVISQASDSYTVQAGDTLVGIARRLGLTPQALAKANALDRPDKIVVGNVLRLPVTPPDTNQTAPAKASAEQPAPAATPTETAQPAATPQAKTPTPFQPTPQALSPTPQAQSPTPGQTPPQARKPSPAQPPVQPPALAEPAQAPSAKADDATGDAARLAVGTYANTTLGSLRVTQTATGIAVSRDNRTIAMRHLLYGVFDGVDASGDIHGLRLQYDDAGQVRALLYSSSSGKDIPFARVKK
jgi:LysM repeat protein